METDFYGIQEQICRVIRYQRKEANELIITNTIEKDVEKWVRYLKDLYQIQKKIDSQTEPGRAEITVNDEVLLHIKEVELVLNKLKKRKEKLMNYLNSEELIHQLTKYYISVELQMNGESVPWYVFLRRALKKHQILQV